MNEAIEGARYYDNVFESAVTVTDVFEADDGVTRVRLEYEEHDMVAEPYVDAFRTDETFDLIEIPADAR